MRILIVDDDAIARDLLRNTLRHAGYKVSTACNGREAMQVLRTKPCGVVVSDWVMPESDGIDLCRAIRSGVFPAYIYVILLTSRDRPADIVEGLSAGADDFVVKPYQPAELLLRVRAGERVLSLETRDLALFALAKLAESRDWETGAHLERMRHYSRVLAQDLSEQPAYRDRVNAEYVRLIYATSPLHDIGKVGIPDSILLKPGRLSDAEFRTKKRHTIIGAKTLHAALRQHPKANFLRVARDIALSHHEHFDGTGYPYGRSGSDIPLCGRIVSLADVYDALTQKRVYKEAMAHEVARAIILDGSGAHFDPDVVQAFLRTENQFLGIRRRFAEQEQASTERSTRRKTATSDESTKRSTRRKTATSAEPVAPAVSPSGILFESLGMPTVVADSGT
jgi:putative two-component system response regulator